MLWLRGLSGEKQAHFSASEKYFNHECIVPKRVSAPFFKAPTSWPRLPLFLKSLCPFPSVLFHPLLRHFRQPFPPTPDPHANPPALIRPRNLFWFKQISKGRIYQFNCRFLSKINFNLLNSFTNRLS